MSESSTLLAVLRWADRWRLLVTLAAIGLGLAGHFAFQRWLSDRIERMKAEAEQQGEWIDARLDLALQVGSQRRQAAMAQAELVNWMERIPNRINDSEIYVLLRELATTSGCQLTDFRPLATQKRTEFQSRNFEISLEGEFEKIFAFMLALQQQSQLHEVSTCHVQESSSNRQLKRVRLEIGYPFSHAWHSDLVRVVGAAP